MKKIEEKILTFINENYLINENDKILVAFSGGADSVFLLSFLKKFQNYFKIDLSAYHLNHMLRNDEAQRDQMFAENFCKKYEIDFFTESIDINCRKKNTNKSIEEIAREVRYERLGFFLSKINFNKIATAHNLNDNTETFFLNLLRGTGISGLKGIAKKRGDIIRPVLIASRTEILEYLKKNNLNYVIDSSNNEDNYQRNFLRNKILPELRSKINPQLDKAIFGFNQIFTIQEGFINRYVSEVLHKYFCKKENGYELKISLFKDFTESQSSEFIKKVFAEIGIPEFTKKDFDKIYSLVKKHKGKSIELKNSFLCYREHNYIFFTQNKNKRFPERWKVEVGKEIRIKEKIIKVEEADKRAFDSNYEIIDAEKIDGQLELRFWHEGDKFQPLGMVSFKNVSDFLQEQKIPSHAKTEQLILCDDKKIICIIGLRIDERVKISTNTKKYFKIEVCDER